MCTGNQGKQLRVSSFREDHINAGRAEPRTHLVAIMPSQVNSSSTTHRPGVPWPTMLKSTCFKCGTNTSTLGPGPHFKEFRSTQDELDHGLTCLLDSLVWRALADYSQVDILMCGTNPPTLARDLVARGFVDLVLFPHLIHELHLPPRHSSQFKNNYFAEM